MTLQFYSQIFSFNKRINSITKKDKNWLKAFMGLFMIFISLNTNGQTITNVGISTAAVCPGSTVSVSFGITNGNGNPRHFTSATKYTIYLSNSAGASFTPIYTSTSSTPPPTTNGGTAVITFSNLTTPATLPVGTGYKISISSDAPSIAANSGTNVSSAITVNNNPTVTFSKAFASSCNGGTDGAISVTASAGASPYTYSWTGPNGFTSTNPQISGLSLGDYTINVTDANQCSTKIYDITIRQTDAIGIGFTTKLPTCKGNDGQINAYRVGGIDDGVTPVQFQLDNGSFQTSGNFSGLPSGNYLVTVKDSKGCSSSRIVNLPSDTRPAPSVGVLQKILPSCGLSNGSISAYRINGVADGITPVKFSLGGDATVPFQTSNVFSNLPIGNYFVTVQDSRGCTGIIQVTLSADPNPAPSAAAYVSNPDCATNDGSLNAFRIGGFADNITPVLFKLDGDATVPYQPSGQFMGLTAGNYTLTVKDSRGCTGVSSTIVLVDNPLIFTPNGYSTNVSACGGGSDGSITATADGGVAPYHYIIDGVEKQVSSLKTFTFENLQVKSYDITVKDSKGCSISKTISLSQESAPTAFVNYTGNVSCIGGNDGFITSWRSGGVPPNYMFSKDGGITYQSSYRFLNLSAGTYNVVVKDSRGCVSSNSVPVVIADGTSACVVGRTSNSTGINNTDNESIMKKESSKTLTDNLLSVQGYPNPFRSEFILDVKGKNTDKVRLTITDILGRKWYESEGMANQQFKLGNNLKTGIYFVQIRYGDSVKTIKIVKE